MTVTVTDLHEPFRATLAQHLPKATAVADAFHVVAVGTRVVERTRRRVQQETLGHRGHKADPLYRSPKLLTLLAVGGCNGELLGTHPRGNAKHHFCTGGRDRASPR